MSTTSKLLKAAAHRTGDLFGDAARRTARAATEGGALGETAAWNNVVDALRELAPIHEELTSALAREAGLREALETLREEDQRLEFDDGDIQQSEFCERALSSNPPPP